MVCYSVVDRESFRNVREFWIPSIKNLKKKHDIVLVATHVDIRESKDVDHVTFDEGFDLCREVNGHTFIECSAADRIRTKQVFESVVSSALAKKKTRFSYVLRKFIGRWHCEKLSKFRPWNCCCNRWCKRSCDAELITVSSCSMDWPTWYSKIKHMTLTCRNRQIIWCIKVMWYRFN